MWRFGYILSKSLHCAVSRTFPTEKTTVSVFIVLCAVGFLPFFGWLLLPPFYHFLLFNAVTYSFMYGFLSFCLFVRYTITALHEQVFIVFMVCSLCHMLIVIKLCQLLKNEIDVQRLPHLILIDEEKSLKFKKILFNISIISTVGLAVFFFKHRVYCHDLAFSAFAFCEYIIASCNLAFHCTTMLDFPSEYLMIARRTTKIKLKHPTGWKLDRTRNSSNASTRLD